MLGSEILRADLIDRWDLIVEFTEPFFFLYHVLKTRRKPVDGKRHRLQVAYRTQMDYLRLRALPDRDSRNRSLFPS